MAMPSRRGAILGASMASLATILPRPASAKIDLNLDSGNTEPLPIAVPNFSGGNPEEQRIGSDITHILAADLERSGLFKPIDPQAYVQKEVDIAVQPDFRNWRLINAQALVNGRVTIEADGRLRVDFRLWDVFAEQQAEAQRYFGDRGTWRRMAHKVADKVYERLTGEAGYFDTRVVFVAESGPPINRVKRLAIMDQDGANVRYLTSGREITLTPRFNPANQEITYLSYRNNKPRVYLFNLDTGQQEVVGDFAGMTFAPRFSPIGDRLIMSLATSGNSNLYAMDLKSRVVKRLSETNAIDTSACYSPDGSQIAFNSSRGGTPQLYVMAADGANPKRITFGQGRYYTPVWSPRGDLIAFTHEANRRFEIGVVRPDGSGERILTSSYFVDGPTWAPNGRVLMYYRQTPYDSQGHASTRLWSIDLTGKNEREVVTPSDASDPAWSPVLP